MKLEDLISPLELCKLIPKGEFEDSAFLWEAAVDMNTGETVNTHTVPRPLRIGCNPFVYHEIAKEFHLYPAPTLEEIIEKLPLDTIFGKEQYGDIWLAHDHRYYFQEQNGATAALKLWLKLKGIDYEK